MSNDVSRDDSARNDGLNAVETSEVQVVMSIDDDAPRPSMLVEVIDSSTDEDSVAASDGPAEVAVKEVLVEPTSAEAEPVTETEPVAEAAAEPVAEASDEAVASEETEAIELSEVEDEPFEETNPFEEMGLSPAVLASITKSGYVTPSEIQAETIPIVLANLDLICLLYTSPSPRD